MRTKRSFYLFHHTKLWTERVSKSTVSLQMVSNFSSGISLECNTTGLFLSLAYRINGRSSFFEKIVFYHKNRSTSIQYFSFASQGRELFTMWVVYDNSLTSMSWITDIFILYLVEYYHFHHLVQLVSLNLFN